MNKLIAPCLFLAFLQIYIPMSHGWDYKVGFSESSQNRGQSVDLIDVQKQMAIKIGRDSIELENKTEAEFSAIYWSYAETAANLTNDALDRLRRSYQGKNMTCVERIFYQLQGAHGDAVYGISDCVNEAKSNYFLRYISSILAMAEKVVSSFDQNCAWYIFNCKPNLESARQWVEDLQKRFDHVKQEHPSLMIFNKKSIDDCCQVVLNKLNQTAYNIVSGISEC